jgi:hypothetical protein
MDRSKRNHPRGLLKLAYARCQARAQPSIAERSNSVSLPAEPGFYLKEIKSY